MVTIHNGIYNYTITLWVGGTSGTAQKKANELGGYHNIRPSLADDSAHAAVFTGDDISHGMWFQSATPAANLVSHESLHSVAHVMRVIQMELTEETEEAWCYLLGWTAQQVVYYLEGMDDDEDAQLAREVNYRGNRGNDNRLRDSE